MVEKNELKLDALSMKDFMKSTDKKDQMQELENELQCTQMEIKYLKNEVKSLN